jgi:hypothetical protein
VLGGDLPLVEPLVADPLEALRPSQLAGRYCGTDSVLATAARLWSGSWALQASNAATNSGRKRRW